MAHRTRQLRRTGLRSRGSRYRDTETRRTLAAAAAALRDKGNKEGSEGARGKKSCFGTTLYTAHALRKVDGCRTHVVTKEEEKKARNGETTKIKGLPSLLYTLVVQVGCCLVG